MSGRVVLPRPFLLQQSLRAPIALLLLPIRLERVAAVMPHHRRGRETNHADLTQAPAGVDVVTGRAEDRIEAANLLQRLSPDREIASRNMLCNFVSQQNVDGTAGRVGHALG